MARPSVDVVVPFRGDPAALEGLCGRLAELRLRPGDTLVVVDNTPAREPSERPGTGSIRVTPAADLATPAYARNRGAALGSAEWLVFLDADVTPRPDLLDRYFDPAPERVTGLLAGGVIDEPVPPDGPPAARYAFLKALTSQDDTLRFGEWGYPKTANVACRRRAFESVHGFRDQLRAAEDADLTFRLRAAGWALERREAAAATHRSRQSTWEFCLQRLGHGSGGAWLDREYPGSFPPRRLAGLLWWSARRTASACMAAARAYDRDWLLRELFDSLEAIAFELGRSLPNERPVTARLLGAHLIHVRAPKGTPRLGRDGRLTTRAASRRRSRG